MPLVVFHRPPAAKECSGMFMIWENLSEPRKKTAHFPVYWLFNKDPYNGLLSYLANGP